MYNGDNHIGGANITKLIVGEGITRIGDYVTQGLGNLQSVSLPSTLKQIGGQNFKRMSDLSEIVFPDGLEEIDYCCFQYCDSLVSVSIPASVTELGWGSFAFCTSLKNIFVNPGNSSYFSDNGVLKRTQYNSTKLCCYPAGKSATHYTITENVNSLGEYAFGGAKNLEEVSFPSGMRSINMGAFSECDNIRRIVLPENLASISASAFNSCSMVPEVEIPDSVTHISSPAFNQNTVLICSPGSAAEQYAKENNHEYRYFDGSGPDTSNIQWAVSEDGTLTITGTGPIPNSYTPWRYDGDNHIGGANITKLIVGEGITRIGDYVTQGLGNLQSVSLPSTLKQIGGQNFKRMSDLSEIVFPDGLEEIDYCCFQYCDSLVSVSIPASVTELGWGSFAFCASLENIYVDPGNSSYFSDNGVLKRTQYNSTKLCCYPAGKSATHYTITENVNSLGEYAFGGAKNLEEVSFPSSMRSINMGAFSECDNTRRIVLPENLTSISAYAFSSCSKVEAVLIPDSVTRISAPAFSRNTIMICLEGSAAEQYAQQNGSRFIYKNDFYINRIPAGCTVIDDDAFFDSNIKCIYIHSNVSSIGNSAFPESTTIICNHGSFAESWANGAGYRIIHIEDFE